MLTSIVSREWSINSEGNTGPSAANPQAYQLVWPVVSIRASGRTANEVVPVNTPDGDLSVRCLSSFARHISGMIRPKVTRSAYDKERR